MCLYEVYEAVFLLHHQHIFSFIDLDFFFSCSMMDAYHKISPAVQNLYTNYFYLGWNLMMRTERDPANFQGKLFTFLQAFSDKRLT